jgi:amino acid transporter
MSDMSFARKASGLVRGLSFIDAFGVGFMNQGLTVSMWVMISLGLSVYTGGNLIIATIISAVLCGIGFSLVWGILGGSMPRSGGEYIYNSRIIHPLIGIAESFGNAFVWVMWIFVLAPWTVDPGMVMLFQFLNMPAAAEFCTQPLALFLISTLVSFIALLFLIFGMKVFALAQKIIMVLGTLGGVIILLIFTFSDKATFIQKWDDLAAKTPVVAVDLSTAGENVDFATLETDTAQADALTAFLTTQLLDRVAAEDVVNPQSQAVIVKAGEKIGEQALADIGQLRNESGLLIQSVAVKSLDYTAFTAVVATIMDKVDGRQLASTWNWIDTLGVMVAGSWLFAYSYCITFIAGEVKRPDKTIILGNLFAVLVPAFFMLWLAIVLYRVVDFQFLSATAYVDSNLGGVLGGLALPWSPHYMGLAAVLNSNPIILIMMAGSFILFNIWYVALSYLAFPRILFAWGMDRMGPKWFADIDYRWATPVKNHILCFILGEIGIAIYSFYQNPMTGLSITALEIVSVFGITAIAAVIFPYVKKVRHIWDASPYKNWKILGVPVVTIGGIVNLIYLGILFYFFYFMPGKEEFTFWSGLSYVVIWGLGIAWYFFWKRRNQQVGVDVSMTYGELPPD